ncbi:MAG: macro domain-containing protein [Phycisphaerales bacterium]|nr:macro domain-containing protein [Phycisphaerales bacterium]
MIQEVTGDILLSTSPVIAHGVAVNDPFHSGLALQLREKFPAMYKDFRHWGQSTHAKPGQCWVWSGSGQGGPVRIACLLTQDGGYEHGARPGKGQLDYVNRALKEFHKWAAHEKPASIALPKLASGVAALPWDAVYPLIKQHLSDLRIPVYVYTTYQKGVKATENSVAPRA